MSVLRTIVSSSRALVTGAKDIARLREILAVFWRHGFGWAIRQLKLRRELQIEGEVQGTELSRVALADPETGKRLVAAFTELGPTWVKFGQILSTRPDLFPPAIIAELARLQDAVGPLPFEEIEAQLRRNLGEAWREHFESVDEAPLGSASIGQVHRAVLVSGEEVVLKVQRPGIRPKIESDLHILSAVAGYVEDAFEEAQTMDLVGMTHDFAKSLKQELDYRAEANNVEVFTRNFADDDKVYLPLVYRDLSTTEVLCMEFIKGRKFTEILESGGDTRPLVEAYFNSAYKMLFIHGFFHGDLHPGNVFIMDDGRLALIDCGMVGRLAPSRKEKVIDIIWAVLNQDLEAVARTLYELSIPQGPVDYPAFEASAMEAAERYLVGVPLSQVQIGELFSELVQRATQQNVRMPTDFTMMFKAIMTTEGLAKAIAPDVDPVELARPFVSQMITERYSPERLRQVALADFQLLSGVARQLPRSLPRLLDNVNSGELAFGLSERTLESQRASAAARNWRSIRAAMSATAMLCGTIALGMPQLPVALAGIPWISLVFWALAGLGALSLIRRGSLT